MTNHPSHLLFSSLPDLLALLLLPLLTFTQSVLYRHRNKDSPLVRSMDIRATRKLNGQPSRARIACLHCRSRKVRCTLTVKGPPCTNCQLDGLECVTCPKLRKRSIHSSLAEDVIPSTPIQEENTAQRYDICTTEKVQDDVLKICDLNGMNIFKRQRTASGGHEARLIEAALSVDSCMFPNNPMSFKHRSLPM